MAETTDVFANSKYGHARVISSFVAMNAMAAGFDDPVMEIKSLPGSMLGSFLEPLPTVDHLLRWMRIKHQVCVNVSPCGSFGAWTFVVFTPATLVKATRPPDDACSYRDYDLALEDGMIRGLKIIQKKNLTEPGMG